MFGKLLIVGVVLLAAGLLARLAQRVVRIRKEAGEAWAGRDPDDPALAGLDEAAFRRAYFRAHGPRGALHLTAGVVAAVVLTAPPMEPSARPVATSNDAKYSGSETASRAASS